MKTLVIAALLLTGLPPVLGFSAAGAVDATISPLCRPATASQHANFCAAVADNRSLASNLGGPWPPCDLGEVRDPHSGQCVPV
jgi:hypothetical protein